MDQMVVQKVTPATFRIGHLALGAILRKGTVVLVRSGNARFDVRGKDVARQDSPPHNSIQDAFRRQAHQLHR